MASSTSTFRGFFSSALRYFNFRMAVGLTLVENTSLLTSILFIFHLPFSRFQANSVVAVVVGGRRCLSYIAVNTTSTVTHRLHHLSLQ